MERIKPQPKICICKNLCVMYNVYYLFVITDDQL